MSTSATQVFVLPIKGRDAEIKKLRELVNQAGCETICDQAPPADYKKCIQDADVLVVLIGSETMEAQAVDTLIVLASRLGKRVVGVWAADLKDPKLPVAINKHGDAVIAPDLAAIRLSVCGDQPNWSMPDGSL